MRSGSGDGTGGRFGLGALLCVLSAAAFGTVGVFGKVAYDHGLGVPDMLAPRFALAAVILWAIVAAMGREHRPTWRGTAVGVGVGGLLYATMAATYFLSLERIDASLTILLAHVAPVFVVAWALVAGRERPSAALMVALPASLVGTALIALGALGGTVRADAVGIVLALVCAALYAAYILVSHDLMVNTHPVVLTAQVATGCAIAFGAWAAIVGRVPQTGMTGWLIILAMALVATVAALFLLAAGTAMVGPSVSALLSNVEPLTATALAFIVLGERLSPVQILGGVLVIGAVVLLTVGGRGGDTVAQGETPAQDGRSHPAGTPDAW